MLGFQRTGSRIIPKLRTWVVCHRAQISIGSKSTMETEGKHSVYVIEDGHVAQKIANVMHKHIMHSQLVIENYPGAGFLTSELLQRVSGSILAVEPRPTYHGKLQNLSLSGQKLHKIRDFPYSSKTMQINFKEFPSTMDVESASDIQRLTVTGMLPYSELAQFLTVSAHRFLEKSGYFSYKHLRMFFIIDGAKFSKIRDSPRVKNGFCILILANLIYKLQCHLKVPKKGSTQIQDISCDLPDGEKMTFNSLDWDKDYLYLVELIPNYALYRLCKDEHLPGLFVFSKRLWQMRNKERLIPLLEHWCPGIGPSLIKAGYDMMNFPKELSPHEFAKLYKIVTSSPNFHESAMWQMVEDTDIVIDKMLYDT